MDIMILIDAIAGLVVAVCAVLGWKAMDRNTKHCYRLVYGVIGLAGAALALDPLFDAGYAQVARMSLVAGFALYMVLDRRGVRRSRDAVAQDPDRTRPLGNRA